MKRITTAIIGITALLLAGCNWQMPEMVTLKTSPEFEAPGGSREIDVLELLDLNTIIDDTVAGIPELSRKDPAIGRPITLELNYDVIDLSVDEIAGDALALDPVDELIDVSYTVPTIDLTAPPIAATIEPLDLPGGITIPGFRIAGIPELDGSTTVTAPSTIKPTGFTSVTFSQGFLDAAFTVANGSGSLAVTIQSATILDASDGTQVATAIGPVESGDRLSFDLTNKTLPNSFDVEIDVSISGATLLESFDLDVAFAFAGSPKLSAASGIEITETTYSDAVTIPIDASLDFVSATIGAGTLDLTPSFPAGWNNITTTIEATLKQGDPLTAIAGGAWGGTWPHNLTAGPLDLAGLEIDKADIVVEYNVKLSGSDATFEVGTAGGDVDASITRFSSISVDDSLIDIPLETISHTVDQETIDRVESITFVNPLMTVTLNNQLPGIAIDFELQSTALTIVTPLQSFLPGSNTTNEWELTPQPDAGDTGSEATLTLDASASTIDLTPVITINDGNNGDGVLTLTDVRPGDSYTLSGSVFAGFEVAKLQIADTSGSPTSGQFPKAGEDALDFSALGGFLPDSVSFTDIVTFLDIALETTDPNAELSIYVTAEYTDGGALVRIPLVEDDITAGKPKVLNATAQIPIDLNQIVNSAPSDLRISYQISAASITLVPGSDQRVAASIASTIPLSFTSTSIVDGDNEIMNPDADPPEPIITRLEDDILGRTGDEQEDSEVQELLAFAEEVSLNYTLQNDLGIKIEAVMIEPARPGFGLEDEFKISFALETGTANISLDQADIRRILDDTDFRPEFHLYIPDGPHAIMEGESVTIEAWLGLKTDIEYTFDLTGQTGQAVE